MRFQFWILAFAAILGGCAHQIVFVNRATGARGTASVSPAGHRSGDIQVALGGKTFSGSWVYETDGGTIGLSTATAHAGLATATANGTFLAMSTQGAGSILASAADGSTLRCQFQFSQMSNTGLGQCVDNAGASYDLQIH